MQAQQQESWDLPNGSLVLGPVLVRRPTGAGKSSIGEGVEWGDEGGYKDEDRQIGGEGSSYPAYWHIYPISLSRPDVPAWISMDLCQ